MTDARRAAAQEKRLSAFLDERMRDAYDVAESSRALIDYLYLQLCGALLEELNARIRRPQARAADERSADRAAAILQKLLREEPGSHPPGAYDAYESMLRAFKKQDPAAAKRFVRTVWRTLDPMLGLTPTVPPSPQNIMAALAGMRVPATRPPRRVRRPGPGGRGAISRAVARRDPRISRPPRSEDASPSR